jgi:ribonuclease HII
MLLAQQISDSSIRSSNSGILIGGVDEAGRGSIIGPLVVAGISIRKSKISKLRQIGVKDSKMLSPKARANLFNLVMDMADSLCINIINCAMVDYSVFLNRLNKLEAETMASVINSIQADKVYIDSCDVNPCRFRDYIESRLLLSSSSLSSTSKPKLYSMHHADSLNVVVSAASIVAKIVRDKQIQEIRNTHHNIGSGYPSDWKTMLFIRGWVSKYKCAPHFARKSWSPLKKMLEEVAQYDNNNNNINQVRE